MHLKYLEVDEQLQWYHALLAGADTHAVTWVDKMVVSGWIYHDLSVEGSIFRDNELQRGLEGRSGANWSENRLLEKVRLLKGAIDFIREHARTAAPFDLEFIKEIHRRLCTHDDERAGRYRKDAGPSTAYRHDISPPTGISYRLRRLVASLEEPDSLQEHPITLACRIHRQLIETFPFAQDNGIVARLAMNAWLLRHDYPPAVIHVHDRHQYFDAYLSENGAFRCLVVTSMLQWMDAWIRGLQKAAGAAREGAGAAA